MKLNKIRFEALRDERLAMKTPGYWVTLVPLLFVVFLMAFSLVNEIQDAETVAFPYRIVAMI